MSKHFGDKLRQLRRQHDWSQGEAVKHLLENCPDMRISQTALSGLEARRLPPRGQVVQQLADAYGVPLEYFYGDMPIDGVVGEDLTRLVTRLSALYREFKSAMPDDLQDEFRALIASVQAKSLE